MQLFHQVSGSLATFSGAPPDALDDAEMRGNVLHIGYGLKLFEEDSGLPGLQVDRAVSNPAVGIAVQFGDGVSGPAPLNAFALIPMVFSGTLETWRARLSVTGDATFDVQYAPTIGGTFVSVGGTQPWVTSGISNEDLNGLDWTTLDFDPGGVLQVTLTGLTTAWLATLTLGVRRT